MPDFSDDKLTYMFRLRSGIKFEEGTPITSDPIRKALPDEIGLTLKLDPNEIDNQREDGGGVTTTPRAGRHRGDDRTGSSTTRRSMH